MTAFEEHRRHLFAVAYRMLGSVAEAEDAVQDTFLRFREVDAESVGSMRAYLTRIITNLCLDRLKSAKARREEYVGTWLPDPVVEDGSAELAHDLSVALLLTLERLSPLERAAFLLHDVFDMDFADVAAALERTEPAVRQLAARAREHVKTGAPRFQPTREEASRLADAFQMALVQGDYDGLGKLLAEDAVFYSDGGGRRPAAINPVFGRDRIVRLLKGLLHKGGGVPEASQVRRVWINGCPGYVIVAADGVETLAIETDGGQIVALYSVRNPDKLRHLSS